METGGAVTCYACYCGGRRPAAVWAVEIPAKIACGAVLVGIVDSACDRVDCCASPVCGRAGGGGEAGQTAPGLGYAVPIEDPALLRTIDSRACEILVTLTWAGDNQHVMAR